MDPVLASSIISILVGAGKAIGKGIKEAREAVAADLEELAAKVRAGDLVDDAMLQRALDDSARIEAARAKRRR